MTVLERGKYHLKESLPDGKQQLTIGSAPIHYLDDQGQWQPINLDWSDLGIPSRPNGITAASLMVSVGDDGLRRIHPTRDLNKYMEIGAPYIKVGGVWTKVSLGTPTRSANLLSWSTANADVFIYHAGHYVKLEVELKNGWTPVGGQFAFPVGLGGGLTRSGDQIKDGSQVVALLRKPLVYDAANPDDRRNITYSFTSVSIGGSSQPILLMTLPDLTGMSRPVVDPTLTIQPDATAGIDTKMLTNGAGATFNYGVNITLSAGATGGTPQRTLIKFDLSSLPSTALITSATLSLFQTGFQHGGATATTIRVYRQKRAWVEGTRDGVDDTPATGATANRYDTTNSWQTAGGFGANDCEQTDIGSRLFPSNETNEQFKSISLTPTTKSGLDLGNGYLIKSDAESGDLRNFASSDTTTAANRPKLVIVYTDSIAPARIESTSAIYTPSIKQAIKPALIASSTALYAPSIRQNLKPARIESSTALYTPSIKLAVTPARIASTATTYTPSIKLAVTPARIESTATVYQAQINQRDIFSRIESSTALYAPSVVLAVTPTRIEGGSALYAPQIVQAVQPSRIGSSLQILDLRIARIDYISTDRIESTSAVYAPRLALLAYIVAARIENTAALFAPTLQRGSVPGRLTLRFEPTVLMHLLLMIGDSPMERKPDVGDQIKARLFIADPTTGAPADPDEVIFKLIDPAGDETTYTYGDDAEIIRVGVGDYYLLISLDQALTWTVRVETSGGYKGAEEESFEVKESAF